MSSWLGCCWLLVTVFASIAKCFVWPSVRPSVAELLTTSEEQDTED